jgi:hypothetical protein
MSAPRASAARSNDLVHGGPGQGTSAHRRRALSFALALLAIAPGACGPRAGQPDPGPGPGREEPGREEIEERAAAHAAGDTVSGAARPRRSGEIARADLNRVLDAGPGAFLGRAEVKVRLARGAFRGWEVVRPPYPEIDLVAGDVVLSVNGRILEHPVDLERLWSDLRAASAIDVDVERAGGRFALRFAVVPPL